MRSHGHGYEHGPGHYGPGHHGRGEGDGRRAAFGPFGPPFGGGPFGGG
ncbi:PadR family transcriptional regulator, partial [Streptomyces griseus]|nr:PadR family transcriptional regulator [Streptomyces griseus]